MSESMSLLSPTGANRYLRWICSNDPEKLTSLCLMHLSFLLDLPDNELEILANTEKNKDHQDSCKAEKRFFRGITRKFTKDNKVKSGSCFGCPLTTDVLKLIKPLFEHLNCDQNLTEGIFRKTGNLSRQKVLRTYLDEGVDIRNELALNSYTSHDCANLLKSFLGELPEPLLAESNFFAYCQLDGIFNESKKLECIQLLMRLIPNENLKLFKMLINLMVSICKKDATLMSHDSLATIFVPHLLVPKNMNAKELFQKLPALTETISFMIRSNEAIFNIPDNLRSDIMQLHRKFLSKRASLGDELTKTSSSSSSATSSATSSVTSTSSSAFTKLKKAYKLGNFSPSRCLQKRKSLEKENLSILASINLSIDIRKNDKKHSNTGNTSCSSDEITTTISFTDKQACLTASKETDTNKALTELYDYISSLPKNNKRKLMKQVNSKMAKKVVNPSSSVTPSSTSSAASSYIQSPAKFNRFKKFKPTKNKIFKINKSFDNLTKSFNNDKSNNHDADDDVFVDDDDVGCRTDDVDDDDDVDADKDVSFERYQQYEVLTPYRKSWLRNPDLKAHVVDCNDFVIGEGASVNLSCNASLILPPP
ncbi:hypothetical protein HELRODRAFT_195047 [Helobdella robusta]|uniref:Rho-GAP domain-containing protein n=1 Tax=Helobdella robusta TaxID=6412 RepID=T1FWP8_HELRO|nr:hypothetical protein HELRODRAFT_195047 [Helobdella robusta]ESO09660.1 hypothetical protein HELRODRAFT_195047 [Helobdella robusta]